MEEEVVVEEAEVVEIEAEEVDGDEVVELMKSSGPTKGRAVTLLPELATISMSKQVEYRSLILLKDQAHMKVYFPTTKLEGILKQPVQRALSLLVQNLGQFWYPTPAPATVFAPKS